MMFRRWITKQVSGCCGVNSHMSTLYTDVENVCPSCGTHNEDTSHIVVCPDAGRTQLYVDTIDELERWLVSVETDPTLTELIIDFLRARGRKTMLDVSCDFLPDEYHLLVKHHDRLGFKNFVEGRMCSIFVQLQHDHLQSIETYKTAETWASGLIERLIKITHRQWLHRNAKLHFKTPNGRTVIENDLLNEKVKEMMWTDPDSLLEEDKALLEEDFEQLGKAEASDKEYWVLEMETAIAVAAGRTANHGVSCPTIGFEDMVMAPDTEGSVRYRRRKRFVHK